MIQEILYLFAAAVVIGLIVWYHRRQAAILMRENNILNLQHDALMEQYGQLDEVLKMTRRYRDSIDEIIRQGNREMLSDEVLADCLAEKNVSPEILSSDICPGNPIIRNVICHKARECEEYMIRLSMELNGIDRLRVKDIELIGIIYNLFDNAIEACRRIPEAEKREIIIRSECEKRFWNLDLLNSSTEEALGSGLKTWKPDHEEHGVGLTIVKDLVRENRGKISWELKDGIFHTKISLPLKAG